MFLLWWSLLLIKLEFHGVMCEVQSSTSASGNVSPLHGSISVQDVKEMKSYSLTEVDYGDLLSLDETALITAANALVTVGGLQVTNIPNFAMARKLALDKLDDCLRSDANVPSIVMNDGSRRYTTAAESIHGSPQAMQSECGLSSSRLRSLTQAVVTQLFRGLDVASVSNEMVAAPYHTFEEIAMLGEHLEHLHAYEGPRSFANGDITMQMHTDSGLLIAMTSGYYKSSSKLDGENVNVENGLYLTLPTGMVVRALSRRDSLILLAGEGASRWLSPKLGAPIRSVPHAMDASLASGESRNWYGKMFLPPADAEITLTDSGTKARYSIYREAEVSAARSAHSSSDFKESLPTGCGGWNSGLVMLTNTLCTAPDDTQGVMCWQQCYSVVDMPCGTSAECIDTATGEPVDGTIMCPSSAGMNACELQCMASGDDDINPNSNNDTVTSDDNYCVGAGTTMYMDGFGSMALRDSNKRYCVNLLFKEWTLDEGWKFALGCLGTILLGIFIEGLSYARRKLYDTSFGKQIMGQVLLVLLHGVSVSLSYFIMLIAMTYNVELFCMVCVGLTLGYGFFNIKAPPPESMDACCKHENQDSPTSGPFAGTGY